MKTLIKTSAIAGIISAPFLGLAEQAQKNEMPNIVLIFCDDMGYGDLSCYGALDYKTPNIDRLAIDGMRFTNFISVQATCTASRAGLLTGCYPNRIGVTGAIGPNAKIGINPNEMTLPEMLKQKNFHTAAIGKWHVGDKEPFLPTHQGFDSYLGLPYSNDMWPVDYDGKPIPPAKADYPPLPLIDGDKPVRYIKTLDDQAELTTIYTERAIKFINENKKHPFFLYLAHSMPHVPIAVSSKFKGKSEQGLLGDVMMELDWSVGEIEKALEKNGLTNNTLVIFASDNGPWLNYGNHAGNTGGLREGKGGTFEGGQRVPCIMKWPGHIPAGTICNRLASTIDIFPTLAAITGAPLPPGKIDGINILELLKGNENANPRQTFLYYYRANSLEAVRMGNWKLVFAHPGRSYKNFLPGNDGKPGKVNENYPFERGLYDLRRDPGEEYNVETLYPDIVKKLEKIAADAREDMGDDLTKMPGKNRRESGRIK